MGPVSRTTAPSLMTSWRLAEQVRWDVGGPTCAAAVVVTKVRVRVVSSVLIRVSSNSQKLTPCRTLRIMRHAGNHGWLPACCRSSAHLFRYRGPSGLDLPLHGFKVEACALLHRRELDRRHGQLFHLLLNEHEAPEFVLEPVEVFLRSLFGSGIGPASALEWIEAQIGQGRHVNLDLATQPTARLIDEAILVVAEPHGAQRAFAEIEDLLAIGRPLAG